MGITLCHKAWLLGDRECSHLARGKNSVDYPIIMGPLSRNTTHLLSSPDSTTYMAIPSLVPRCALTRTVVISFVLLLISFTLLFSYHPPFKATLSNFATFNTSHTTYPPYTAAVVYLVRLSHADELLESLAYVNAYLPFRDPWPIILFHTAYFDDTPVQVAFLASLSKKIGGPSNNSELDSRDRVGFVKPDWVLPEGIPHTKEELDPVSSSSWPSGNFEKSYKVI